MKLLLGGSDEINQDLQKIKNHQKMFVEAADPHDKIHPRKERRKRPRSEGWFEAIVLGFQVIRRSFPSWNTRIFAVCTQGCLESGAGVIRVCCIRSRRSSIPTSSSTHANILCFIDYCNSVHYELSY